MTIIICLLFWIIIWTFNLESEVSWSRHSNKIASSKSSIRLSMSSSNMSTSVFSYICIFLVIVCSKISSRQIMALSSRLLLLLSHSSKKKVVKWRTSNQLIFLLLYWCPDTSCMKVIFEFFVEICIVICLILMGSLICLLGIKSVCCFCFTPVILF